MPKAKSSEPRDGCLEEETALWVSLRGAASLLEDDGFGTFKPGLVVWLNDRADDEEEPEPPYRLGFGRVEGCAPEGFHDWGCGFRLGRVTC